MEWFKKFWDSHGERLTFMGLASGFGLGFLTHPELMGEGKTILVMVAGILVNKVRGALK